MNFTSMIKSETNKKYKEMLDDTIGAPFCDMPKILEQITYSDKRDEYYKRLNSEKEDFNNAISQVINNRKKRYESEKENAELRARHRHENWKRVKTIIFFIPLVLCALIGYDLFNKKHGQMFNSEKLENFSLGWAIFLYAIACIASLICLIKLCYGMAKNDRFKSGEKRYNVFAILILVFSLILVAINLFYVATSTTKYKVKFLTENNTKVEYIKEGETIILPSISRGNRKFESYVAKYTFDGWLIDGKLYKADQEYKPEGNVSLEAKFIETDWATVQIVCNNASVKLEFDGISLSSSVEDNVEIKVGTSIKVIASFDYPEDDYAKNSLIVGNASVENPYTFTVKGNTSITAKYTDSSCLVEGTKITLFDGTKKLVEDLLMGDVLAVFNHETGKFEAAPLLANIHANEEANYYNVINLNFSNGEKLRIVDEHGLFDKTLNKYVYIREDNASDFLGHTFVSSKIGAGKLLNTFVELTSFNITNEYVKIYNPASEWHINVIANDMLVLSAGMVNLFSYDETMQYDMNLMEQDINKYGLYTYDDFKDYVPFEVFKKFPFKYYKVAVEKGQFTFEQILGLIDFYYDNNSIK